jgi:hypothetical protein
VTATARRRGASRCRRRERGEAEAEAATGKNAADLAPRFSDSFYIFFLDDESRGYLPWSLV